MSDITIEVISPPVTNVTIQSAPGTAGTTVAWDSVTGKPLTFAPSAHTHPISEVTGLQTALDGKQPTGAYASTVHSHAISDVSGLQTALDNKSAVGHGHSIGDVSGLQTALNGKAASVHGHVVGDVSGLQTALDSKASTSHAAAHVTGGADKIRDASASQDGLMTAAQASKLDGIQAGAEINVNADWNAATGDAAIQNKPATFPPSAHGHAIADVSGLQTALDGKAATGHTHGIPDVTGLQTALDGKQAAGSYASTVHSHSISDVTGLQTALNGKAASAHSHGIADVTGLQTALDGKAALIHAHAIGDLSGVSITSPANDEVLAFESSTGLWKNKTPTGGGGGITNEQSVINALIFG